MRFTRYYSKLLDAQGTPHLSVEQHKRLFNIVTLESRLDELNKLKEGLKDSDLKYKSEVRIFRLQEQLKKLTDNQYPKDIMENMFWKTSKD
jgi:hypothetical protein